MKFGILMHAMINFLERVEDEHSRLLIAQAKADAEMHSDIDVMKFNLAVLDGKVTYCMDMIDETFTESDGMEEEEEETPVVDDDEADAFEIQDCVKFGASRARQCLAVQPLTVA